MKKYCYNTDELVKVLHEAISRFLEYQFKAGFEEPRARAEAVSDIMGAQQASGVRGEEVKKAGKGAKVPSFKQKTIDPEWMKLYRDFAYDRFADILSIQAPIEDHREAFNCASAFCDVLHTARSILDGLSLGASEREALSELLGALEIVARRVQRWEGKLIGIDVPISADVKFINLGSRQPE